MVPPAATAVDLIRRFHVSVYVARMDGAGLHHGLDRAVGHSYVWESLGLHCICTNIAKAAVKSLKKKTQKIYPSLECSHAA